MAKILGTERRHIVIAALLSLAIFTVGISLNCGISPSIWSPLVESSMPQYGISSSAPLAMSDQTASLRPYGLIDEKELQHAKFMGCTDEDGIEYYMGVYDFTGDPPQFARDGTGTWFLVIADSIVSTKTVSMCGVEFKENISKCFNRNRGGVTRIHLSGSRVYFFIVGSNKLPVESILSRAERFFKTVKMKVE